MYRIVLNETSYYGAGCRSVIAEEVRKRGFRKALLVVITEIIIDSFIRTYLFYLFK